MIHRTVAPTQADPIRIRPYLNERARAEGTTSEAIIKDWADFEYPKGRTPGPYDRHFARTATLERPAIRVDAADREWAESVLRGSGHANLCGPIFDSYLGGLAASTFQAVPCADLRGKLEDRKHDDSQVPTSFNLDPVAGSVEFEPIVWAPGIGRDQGLGGVLAYGPGESGKVLADMDRLRQAPVPDLEGDFEGRRIDPKLSWKPDLADARYVYLRSTAGDNIKMHVSEARLRRIPGIPVASKWEIREMGGFNFTPLSEFPESEFAT